ncbi:MAG: T9SS type A sorting domain-containing protein [Calditrichota bacterium]
MKAKKINNILIVLLMLFSSVYTQESIDGSGIKKSLDLNKIQNLNQDIDSIKWTQNPYSLPLPNPHRGFGCVSNGNYIYILGGDSARSVITGLMDYVAFSEIQNDGSLGAWKETTQLPVQVWEPEAVIYQDNIYIIGGRSSKNSNEVYKSKINIDGTLSDWVPQASLPTEVYGHTTIFDGHRIYVIGGWYNTDTYFSEIDANGDLGIWNSTTPLTERLYASDASLYNNKIFLYGGKEIVGDSQTIVSTVRYANILANGQLGSWQVTDAMPDARWFHQVVQYDSIVFIVGGGEDSSTLEIQKGKINSDGSIYWNTIGNIPEASMGNGLILNNNFLYYIAGEWSNSVYYADIENQINFIDKKPPYQPNNFVLDQNYPNPFNPVTTIKYTLHKKAQVRIEIYNSIGQRIETLIDKKQLPDKHRIQWDASNNQLPSGVYFYQMIVDDEIRSRRMIYLK